MNTIIPKPKYLTTADFRRVSIGHRDNSDPETLFTLSDYVHAIDAAYMAKDYDMIAKIITASQDQYAQAQNLDLPSEGVLRSFQYLEYASGNDLTSISHRDPLFAQALIKGMFAEANNIGYSVDGANFIRAHITQSVPKVA